MCGSHALSKIWSFGPTPLANAYLKPEEKDRPEHFVPLDVWRCNDCHLVQLRDVVSPEVLFSHYLYVSSTSPKFVAHFEEYAAHLVQNFGLNSDSLVVDVGSNDGVLLKPLKRAGIQVLGIDPAENIAQKATREGIETVAEFFTPEAAAWLAEERGRAGVITANNVFAHTDNVDTFVEAVKILLRDDGVFIFEVQYLGDLIAHNLFDIVYHEHVCYYHIRPLVKFFEKHGMEIFDVKRVPVHGGSIRVYVQPSVEGKQPRSQRLDEILREENQQALNTQAPYQQFADRIKSNKEKLLKMLRNLKAQGSRIVGYGAPAKATTLMYAFGIGASELEYIVDDDAVMKQGRLMPGTHVPILPPAKLYQDKPDFCLILAWNFAEPIMEAHSRFTAQGGRFIIPVPEPRIF